MCMRMTWAAFICIYCYVSNSAMQCLPIVFIFMHTVLFFFSLLLHLVVVTSICIIWSLRYDMQTHLLCCYALSRSLSLSLSICSFFALFWFYLLPVPIYTYFIYEWNGRGAEVGWWEEGGWHQNMNHFSYKCVCICLPWLISLSRSHLLSYGFFPLFFYAFCR